MNNAMRLLHLHTLEFKEFFHADIPPYAILSHRWGKGEISYKDMRKKRNPKAPGYAKILGFCDFARRQPATIFERKLLEWGWVDTCCIDKSSSAELSEAINSMYQWYEAACLCCVYLADIESLCDADGGVDDSFVRSEWFKRGWTLQELLAPGDIVFCSATWDILGHICPPWQRQFQCNTHDGIGSYCYCIKERGRCIYHQIAEATGIAPNYFGGQALEASVGCRMSWAADRKTSRVEDEAYCLLGLLGVNIPIIYGEGRRAFQRLQEELIRRSPDLSVLAWSRPDRGCKVVAGNLERLTLYPVLAPDPSWFAGAGDLPRWMSHDEDASRDGKQSTEWSSSVLTQDSLKFVAKTWVYRKPFGASWRLIYLAEFRKRGCVNLVSRTASSKPLRLAFTPDCMENASLSNRGLKRVLYSSIGDLGELVGGLKSGSASVLYADLQGTPRDKCVPRPPFDGNYGSSARPMNEYGDGNFVKND